MKHSREVIAMRAEIKKIRKKKTISRAGNQDKNLGCPFFIFKKLCYNKHKKGKNIRRGCLMITFRGIYGFRSDVVIFFKVSVNKPIKDVIEILKEMRPCGFFLHAVRDMKTERNLLK